MSPSWEGVFVAWLIFQRRTESVANNFNLETKYYYYSWESRSKLHKAWSYVLKSVRTLNDLIAIKPKVIFFQLPPIPILYIVAVYCRFTGCKYIADCHNRMIYGRQIRFPYAKSLLRKADALLVHNEDVEIYADRLNLEAVTLRDPLPDLRATDDIQLLEKYGLSQGAYIIVPWSFAPDEPIGELFQAARSMPGIRFVMTWFSEKLARNVRESMPENVVLTGYLDDSGFNSLFSQAGAALVLTTREGTQPSAASEAIMLSVPLVLSDLKTTRKLYGDMPVYVQNTAEGIRTGVIKVLNEREERAEKTLAFSERYKGSLSDEIAHVKTLLGRVLG